MLILKIKTTTTTWLSINPKVKINNDNNNNYYYNNNNNVKDYNNNNNSKDFNNNNTNKNKQLWIQLDRVSRPTEKWEWNRDVLTTWT